MREQEDLRARFLRCVGSLLHVEPDAIDLSRRLAESGFDSLDWVELSVALEDLVDEFPFEVLGREGASLSDLLAACRAQFARPPASSTRPRSANEAGGSSPEWGDRRLTLTGRRVQLRPVRQSDYDFLYGLSLDPAIAYRWRFRGGTPSPENFVGALWDRVLVQFLVERRQTAERLGLVSLINADFRNGIADLAIVLPPIAERRGWVLFDSLSVFLEYVFRSFGFRKIYAELSEPAFADVASGRSRDLFSVEGHFVEHELFDGVFRDKYVISIRPEQVREHVARLRRETREAESGSGHPARGA